MKLHRAYKGQLADDCLLVKLCLSLRLLPSLPF